LQAQLCGPCLSALCVPWCKKALYKYSSFPFLILASPLPCRLWANTTLSTKPEVHSILQCRHRRIESRPQLLTCTESFVKFGREMFERTDRQTDRQTYRRAQGCDFLRHTVLLLLLFMAALWNILHFCPVISIFFFLLSFLFFLA